MQQERPESDAQNPGHHRFLTWWAAFRKQGRGGLWMAIAVAVLAWNSVANTALLRDAAAYQSAGASTFVVEAEAGVDGRRCEAATDLPNVEAAGAMRAARSQIRPAATPGVDLPTFEVTPGLPGVLYGDATNRNGVFLSIQVSDALGLARNDGLATQDRTIPIGGVFPYPDDGRHAGLGYAALRTVPATDAFDQCWVRMWPESDQVRSLVTASVVAETSHDQPPVVSQLNTTFGAEFHGDALFRERPSALAPFALMSATAAMGFVCVRLRRLELAAARMVGVRTLDQVHQLCLETAAWLTAAAPGSLAAWILIGHVLGSDLAPPTVQYGALSLVAAATARWPVCSPGSAQFAPAACSPTSANADRRNTGPKARVLLTK